MMASRLQFQTPTPHIVAPLQETVVPNTSPTTYPIEAELLGTRPRVVVSVPPQLGLSTLITPLLAIVSILQFVSLYGRVTSGKMPLVIFFCLCILPVIFIIWCVIFTYKKNKREVALLRRGVATPATITGIEQDTNTFRLTVEYQTLSGQCETVVSSLTEATLSKHNLTVGSVFTLLVSPENDNNVLPYFQVTDYRVVPIEATQISHEVSARIAAQAARASFQTVGRLGAIEPELLGTTQRIVRATSSQRRYQAWAFGFLAAVATFVVFAPRLGIHLNWFHKFQFVSQILIQAFLSPVTRQRAGNHNLLKNGVPVRALITAEEDLASNGQTHIPKRTISFSYQFEWNGEIQNNSFSMPRKRAWQLGLAEGATFTVLCDFKKPSVHIPYFQIKDVEIVGAMGAKITPP